MAAPDLPRTLEAALVPVDDLHLDPGNPRIRRADGNLPEDEILEILWRDYSADEIAMSIAHNGYFPHEPLFAAREDGRLVVVEGNRRLAAVRVLRDPGLRAKLGAAGLPAVGERAVRALDRLPVIRCGREDAWRYIGFKHVNGPQAWSSFTKAEYVARVRNDLGAGLGPVASALGDTHGTVARLYRAYMALRQARDSGVYDYERRMSRHFPFSHLYAGLDYPGIGKFVGIAGLDPPQERPVPQRKLKSFGELCVWLWGDRDSGRRPVVRSQNPHLRQLDGALGSERGVSALRAGYGVTQAFDIARGDAVLFGEALLEAKQALQQAYGKVVTGYGGESGLLEEARQIFELAGALSGDMERKVRRRILRRATGS